MTALVILIVTLVGSIILNARHQRRLRRLNGRGVPLAALYFRRSLTDDEAAAIKAEWLRLYGRKP